MKKIAPHISSKRGSMLMLTLIVFMVILILGMTMITSMLYSQGENTMQINEQKAYYAAQSAVEAVKAYFLNPELDSESDISPHDLIGKTCTYNLTDQEIDEETTVTIEIIDGGDVPNESSKNYILIEATGICQGEQSTVRARMIEEEQKGGGGLYSSKVVLGANSIGASSTGKKINIIGNMLIDDINTNGTGIYIGGFDFTPSNEDKEGGTLFIKSEKSVVLEGNKFEDVFIETKETIDVNGNQEIRNIYVSKLDENNTSVKMHNNKIKGEVQLFINNAQPSILDNQIVGRLIVSAKIVPDWSIQRNGADEVYIKGAERIGPITGNSDKHMKVLYTDTIDYKIESYYNIDRTEKINLDFISGYEQEMKNIMEGIEETSNILKEKPFWVRPEASKGFIELGESDVAKDSRNWKFKEYYDPDRKIRLVFPDESKGYDRSKNYYIRYGVKYDDISENDYFVSNDPKYQDDQIFFIAEEAQVINFRKVNPEDKFEALYIYAPNAQCEIPKSFQYFKGGIIVRYLIIDAPETTFIFKEPENIEGIGVPGASGSTGTSGKTSYTYHFEAYIENDKDQS